MLIAFLLVCLIVAVIFHKEIKALISLLFVCGFMYALWSAGGRLRILAIVIFALAFSFAWFSTRPKEKQ